MGATTTIFTWFCPNLTAGLSTWWWLHRLKAGIDAPVVAAAFVPLALGIRAAAGHLTGSVRQSLGWRRAAVILLVVGTVRMKRVLIILAKKRKGKTQVWHKESTNHPINWNRRGIFKAVLKYSWGRTIICSAFPAPSSMYWRHSYITTLAPSLETPNHQIFVWISHLFWGYIPKGMWNWCPR